MARGDLVEAEAAAAREALEEASSVVALTGAGISTESGIPDFRGPQGVWTKNPGAERTATLQHYLADPEIRKQVWQTRLHSPAWSAAPNAGHVALVDLERQGRLRAIVTQNIDGMHQKAGSNPGLVIELHGTMHHVMCWSCGSRAPMPPVLERVRAGEDDPACVALIDGQPCGGVLKSATISFGQALDPEVLERAVLAVQAADLVLAVGSTLAVHPAAGLVPLAARFGIPVVIVNADPTPYDDVAVAVVRTPIGRALPPLVTR
ncbi:MAG: NAD-dependent deacetylase [Acidimicrobiaceae bacterium]|nr:NAD-dependent deacetylase [Acidimicrobiaceae bacterium]MDQ1365540.1 NAD-dependent deacetylase [Acidimicrobiaceae bacterium]MDQ1376565.1 NAD-dependent deacetylase [Acidimicrobiaceae bacterium]MDQ1416455.1 NAD-dependent deacetylase [Acidimicrobiaceae bacterium]MDQ1419870.1 NAD-dependent deacetylase [Acidimicrobiaceae bacterium]